MRLDANVKRVVGIGVFYKNDVPEGFGIDSQDPSATSID